MLPSRWWMHRDQKMDDASVCFQSSLYFEDCERESDDSFICCPGSHLWENGVGWETSATRDHVSVPHEDPMVREHARKLIIKKGEMILWNSKLAHMGGYITKKGSIPVSMIRLPERAHDDIENIKADLRTSGVTLVKDVADAEEMNEIYAQFCRDVSKIYDIPTSERVFDNPDFVFGRQNKGGGTDIVREGGVGRPIASEAHRNIQKIIGLRRPVRGHRFAAHQQQAQEILFDGVLFPKTRAFRKRSEAKVPRTGARYHKNHPLGAQRKLFQIWFWHGQKQKTAGEI